MSPFRSKAQERFLYARHPDIARQWQARYGQPKNLPARAKRKPTKKSHYTR